MACLGGTKAEPLPWVRYDHDGVATPQFGRICNRTIAVTSPRSCAQCVAFRGRRHDMTIANGLGPDDDPYALSLAESDRYESALIALLDDDDFEPFGLWLDSMARVLELGPDRKWRVFQPMGMMDPDERNAARQARWRADHPGEGATTAEKRTYRAANPDRYRAAERARQRRRRAKLNVTE